MANMSGSEDESASRTTHDANTALLLNSFSCQLLDPDRKPRQLYGVRIVDPNTIEAYVEARLDERFMVRLTGQNPKHSYDARLLIGGNDVQGMAVHEDPWHADFMGRPEGKGVVRPYTFAQLQVSDDSSAVRDPRTLADLGVVEICLKRIASLTPHDFKPDTDDPFKNGKIVHEKAKRLGGVQFALGDTRRSKTSAKSFYVRHDNKAEPIRFIFKCMTRFGLELQSIIPSSFPVRKRQPSDLESASASATVSPKGEMVSLIQDGRSKLRPRYFSLEANGVATKRQRLRSETTDNIQSDADVKVDVKQEAAPEDGLGTVEAPVELNDSDDEQDEQDESRRCDDHVQEDDGPEREETQSANPQAQGVVVGDT